GRVGALDLHAQLLFQEAADAAAVGDALPHAQYAPMSHGLYSSFFSASAAGAASFLAGGSPSATAAAGADSIAMSVLVGSTARQLAVSCSLSSRRYFCHSSGVVSSGVTCENSPHRRMSRSRCRKMMPSCLARSRLLTYMLKLPP